MDKLNDEERQKLKQLEGVPLRTVLMVHNRFIEKIKYLKNEIIRDNNEENLPELKLYIRDEQLISIFLNERFFNLN